MYVLRPPHEEERSRSQAFLPAPPQASYLIASARSAPSPARIVGAAAWWFADSPAVALCRWRILPRWERPGQSLPADLLDALTAEVANAGAASLHTAGLIPEGTPMAAELSSRGWTVDSRNEFYEADAADARARIEATCKRLQSAPRGAQASRQLRATPLNAELFPAIVRLMATHGLVAADELALRLARLDQPDGYSKIASLALVTNGTPPALAAAVLVRLDASTAEIDAQAVDREVCAGAGVNAGLANALLLRTVFDRGYAAGVGRRLRFRAHPGVHQQTANFARRCGAHLVGISCAWSRRF